MVRDKTSRQMFALKMVAKRKLLEYKPSLRTEYLLREKSALEDMSHPFITELFGTYDEDEHLCFLLGLSLGGELYSVMERVGKMPESAGSFYVASLTLALMHIHSRECARREPRVSHACLPAR